MENTMGSKIKLGLELTSIVSGLLALVWVASSSFEKKADAIEVNQMNVRLSVIESKVDDLKIGVDNINAKLDKEKN